MVQGMAGVRSSERRCLLHRATHQSCAAVPPLQYLPSRRRDSGPNVMDGGKRLPYNFSGPSPYGSSLEAASPPVRCGDGAALRRNAFCPPSCAPANVTGRQASSQASVKPGSAATDGAQTTAGQTVEDERRPRVRILSTRGERNQRSK